MESTGPRYPNTEAPLVTSFRVEAYPPERAAEFNVEEAGFALLHGSDGNDYYATMTRAEGVWQVTETMPNPLG